MQNEFEYTKQVDKLLQIWELLVSYLNATGEVTAELIDFIEKNTLAVVLRNEWSKTATAARTHLHELSTQALALASPSAEQGGGVEGKSGAPGAGASPAEKTFRPERFLEPDEGNVRVESARDTLAALSDAIADPWPELVRDILYDERKEPDDAVLAYFYKEFGTVLKTRIQVLVYDHLDKMALRLVATFIRCLDDNSWNLRDTKWKVAHYYLDVHVALLYKYKRVHSICSQLKQLSNEEGILFVKRYLTKDPSERLWRHSVKIADLAVQMFTALAITHPERVVYPDFMEQMVTLWKALCERDQEIFTTFPREIKNVVMRHTDTSENIFALSKAMMRQVGSVMRPYCIELNIRALMLHVNTIVGARQQHDIRAPPVHAADHPLCNSEDIKLLEKMIAPRLEELAHLLHPAPVARRECLLSAFCMHPTSRRLATLLTEVFVDGGGHVTASSGAGDRRRSTTDQPKIPEGRLFEGVAEQEEQETQYPPQSSRRDAETHETRKEEKKIKKEREEDEESPVEDGRGELAMIPFVRQTATGCDDDDEVQVVVQVPSEAVPGDLIRDPAGLRECAPSLGVQPSLCDDLLIIFCCNRVRSLSWALPWEELQARCIAYLRDGHGARLACRPLLFLHPDFSMFPVEFSDLQMADLRTARVIISDAEEESSDSSEERTVNVFEGVLTTEEEKRSRSIRAKRNSTYQFEELDESPSEEDEEEDLNQNEEESAASDEGTEEGSIVAATPHPPSWTSDDDIPMTAISSLRGRIPSDLLNVPSLLSLASELATPAEANSSKRGRKRTLAECRSERRASVQRIETHSRPRDGVLVGKERVVSSESSDSQATASGDETALYDGSTEATPDTNQPRYAMPIAGFASTPIPLGAPKPAIHTTPPMESPMPNSAPKMKRTQIKILSPSGPAKYVTLYVDDKNNPSNHTFNASSNGFCHNSLASTPGTLGSGRVGWSQPYANALPVGAPSPDARSTQIPAMHRALSQSPYHRKPSSTMTSCEKNSTVGKEIVVRKEHWSSVNEKKPLPHGPDSMTQNRQTGTHEFSEREVKYAKLLTSHQASQMGYSAPRTPVARAMGIHSSSYVAAPQVANMGLPVNGFGQELTPTPILVPRHAVTGNVNLRDPRLVSGYRIPFKKSQQAIGYGQSTVLNQQERSFRTEEPNAPSVGDQGSVESKTKSGGVKAFEKKINVFANQCMGKRFVIQDPKRGNNSNVFRFGNQGTPHNQNSVAIADNGPLKCFGVFNALPLMGASSKLPAHSPFGGESQKCRAVPKCVVSGPRCGAAVPPLQAVREASSHPSTTTPNSGASCQWRGQRPQVEERATKSSKTQLNKRKKETLSVVGSETYRKEGSESLQVAAQGTGDMLGRDGQNNGAATAKSGKRGRNPAKEKKTPQRNGVDNKMKQGKVNIVQKQACATLVDKVFVEKRHQYLASDRSSKSLSTNAVAIPNSTEKRPTLAKPKKSSGKSQSVTDSSMVLNSRQIVQSVVTMAPSLESFMSQCEAPNFPPPPPPALAASRHVSSQRSKKQTSLVPSAKGGRKGLEVAESKTKGVVVRKEGSKEMTTVYTTEVKVTKCERIVAFQKRKYKKRDENGDDDSDEWTPNKEMREIAARAKALREKRARASNSSKEAMVAALVKKEEEEEKKKDTRGRKRRIETAAAAEPSSSADTEKSPTTKASIVGKSLLSPHLKRLRSPECAAPPPPPKRQRRESARSKAAATE